MITTVDELIEALGGTSAAAALLGVGMSVVSNWRSRGRIPAEKFMILAAALDARGNKKVDPKLFGFEPAEARR